jgi:hypothetical protein
MRSSGGSERATTLLTDRVLSYYNSVRCCPIGAQEAAQARFGLLPAASPLLSLPCSQQPQQPRSTEHAPSLPRPAGKQLPLGKIPPAFVLTLAPLAQYWSEAQLQQGDKIPLPPGSDPPPAADLSACDSMAKAVLAAQRGACISTLHCLPRVCCLRYAGHIMHVHGHRCLQLPHACAHGALEADGLQCMQCCLRCLPCSQLCGTSSIACRAPSCACRDSNSVWLSYGVLLVLRRLTCCPAGKTCFHQEQERPGC